MNNTWLCRLMQRPLTIFVSALIIRLGIGCMFWGGCDLEIWQKINLHLIDHTSYFLPYLPFVEWFIWIGGLLALHTNLPLHFCYKLAPLFFDALLVVLVYDLTDRLRGEKQAITAAWLYAFSCIPLCALALHAQWDSISIFLLLFAYYIREIWPTKPFAYLSFGALLATSFLVKPITLVFFGLLFVPYYGFLKQIAWMRSSLLAWFCSSTLLGATILTAFKFFCIPLEQILKMPWFMVPLIFLGMLGFYLGLMLYRHSDRLFKNYLLLQLMTVCGLLGAAFLYCCMMYLLGLDLIHAIDTVMRYMNRGTILFGLPCVDALSASKVGFLIQQRALLLLALIPVCYWYYQQRLSVFNSILIIYLLLLGTSGLVQHYLLWPLALLIVLGKQRIASLYNIIAVFISIFYYIHPYANVHDPFQNATGLIPLRIVEWLTPYNYFKHDWWLTIFYGTANYVLPFFCLFAAYHVFCDELERKSISMLRNPLPTQVWFYIGGITVLCIALGCIHYFYGALPITSHDLRAAFARKLQYYAYKIQQGRYVYDEQRCSVWFNSTVLIFIGSLLWSFIAYKGSCNDKKEVR